MAQCRGHHCAMCELLEARRNMENLDRGSKEVKQDVVVPPTQCAQWQRLWEEMLLVEAQERTRYLYRNSEKTLALHAMEESIKIFIRTQES